jgi:hypothetical protein
MADTPTFQSNPYGSFDPSQWSNPYSSFYGRALPWPSSYLGTPNNALGQPIAPPQGLTLNSTPAQPQAPPAAGTNSPPPGVIPFQHATMPDGMPYGQTSLGRGVVGSSWEPSPYMPPQQQQQAPAAAPAGPNNWQSTLAMLGNPGPVTTPGATVPQAPQGSAEPSPGVLQNFLANWRPAQSGPGAGFTQNFNTILRGLQAQKGS